MTDHYYDHYSSLFRMLIEDSSLGNLRSKICASADYLKHAINVPSAYKLIHVFSNNLKFYYHQISLATFEILETITKMQQPKFNNENYNNTVKKL